MEPGVVGSVLSALIGAAAGIVTVIWRERSSKDRKISKTWRAIYTEIDSANLEVARELIECNHAQPFYRWVDFLATNAYDQHIGNLELLLEEEIEAVVQYYSLAKVVRSESSELYNIAESDEYEYFVGQSAIKSIRNDLSNFITRQESAEDIRSRR